MFETTTWKNWTILLNIATCVCPNHDIYALVATRYLWNLTNGYRCKIDVCGKSISGFIFFWLRFSISMSYCKWFRGAPEFPTPRMLQSQFHVPTINFGGYVSCNIMASKFKTCLFPQSNHRPHDFCPHRNPYHMDAGQYFASIEFISTSKSHTIHVW